MVEGKHHALAGLLSSDQDIHLDDGAIYIVQLDQGYGLCRRRTWTRDGAVLGRDQLEDGDHIFVQSSAHQGIQSFALGER